LPDRRLATAGLYGVWTGLSKRQPGVWGVGG